MKPIAVLAIIGAVLLGLGPVRVAPAQGVERAATPDLSGMWWRPTFGYEQPASSPGPLTGLRRGRNAGANPDNPILTPAATAALRKHNEILASGSDFPTPSSQCLPMAPPYIFRVQEIQVLQQKDQVVFLYMQDHQFRHVRLNQLHPAKVAPSWHGDSVGHYEGDTLVVDTVGLKVGPYSTVDMYGTPFTEALHVVERYRRIPYEAAQAQIERDVQAGILVGAEQAATVDENDKGMGLQVLFTVEDQNIFTMAWSGGATYRHAEGWFENVCAENTHEYYRGSSTRVPEAGKPDF